jgi:putative SOS response-associated peptidase YedK
MATIEEKLRVHWEGQEWQPVYHASGFSFLQMPVITQADPKYVQLFNWGLIPSWIKTKIDADKLKAQTLNARSETAFEKPSFRSGIKYNRCLIPADGFFEWREVNKKKYPHYIFMKNQELFCFGGIYANWTDRFTGELIQSFSILTTDANPMMEKIHNSKKRMPVIIPSNGYEHWLDNNLMPKDIQQFFKPFSESEMAYHTISKLITSKVENSNVPEVLEACEYPELKEKQ